MKIWITKNINFGYKYTINKNIRKNINSCLYKWLNDFLINKSKDDDILIISGGIFSNTNPSLIAINDAKKFIKSISSNMKIFLINTEKDIRKFNDEYYSTNDIFSDIENVNIINNITEINNLTIIPYGFNIIDCKPNDIYLDSNDNKIDNIDIPDVLKFNKDDNNNISGIIVYDLNTKKNVFLKNNYSPEHIIIELNNLNDIKNLKDINKKDFIYLTIDNDLYQDKKVKIDLLIQKLNINELNINKKEEDKITKINTNLNINIKDMIYEHIGDNNELKTKFEKILNISK